MNTWGVGRILDSYDFVLGFPTHLVFISGSANTENVFYCLMINVISANQKNQKKTPFTIAFLNCNHACTILLERNWILFLFIDKSNNNIVHLTLQDIISGTINYTLNAPCWIIWYLSLTFEKYMCLKTNSKDKII